MTPLLGCVMIPTNGSGGRGHFESTAPITGFVLDLTDSFVDLGYDVSISEPSEHERTLMLEFPSRSGRIVIATDPSNATHYAYSYRLSHGVWDFHEDRRKDEFKHALHTVIEKWRAQP